MPHHGFISKAALELVIIIIISVGWYHIFASGIRYYKLRTVFSIPRYLIKQVDEPLSSVNGKPPKSANI